MLIPDVSIRPRVREKNLPQEGGVAGNISINNHHSENNNNNFRPRVKKKGLAGSPISSSLAYMLIITAAVTERRSSAFHSDVRQRAVRNKKRTTMGLR